MLMRVRTLIVGILLAGVALAEPRFPIIQSSTPLSLDSLIALGTRYNPGLRQTVLDTRLSRIGRINAVGNFLPTVSVGMGFSQSHYRNETYTNADGSVSRYASDVTTETTWEIEWLDTLSDGTLANPRLVPTTTTSSGIPEGDNRSSNWSVSLSESIFEGGRRVALYQLAKTQERIYNLSVVDGKKSLAAAIAQQVMVVLTQEKLVDLDKKLRDQRKDAYDLAKARYDVGSVTELDVLQAQIELGTAENTVKSAERDLQGQRDALNQMLGISLDSHFPLEAMSEASPYEFEIAQLIGEAYANRTDLNIAELSVKRAKQNLTVSYAEYLPTASLSYSYSRSQQSGKNESWTINPQNENSSVGLNLHWNLFDGFSREYNLASEKITRDKAIESERQLRLQLEKDVRDAFNNVETVYDQLQITARNRELAERTLNLERERYRLGATSSLGLRDAQVTYAQAETEHLQKTLEYHSSLIALELAVGKRLH
jgi:outer membrane protein